MGRTSTSAYLATPPTSTMLTSAQSSETLPELLLGPPGLATSPDQDRTSSSPVRQSNPPVEKNVARTAAKSASKKGKPSRRTTHSQIEKRRREKINDTMQRLKDLVPACHVSDATLRKLDILKATADYIEVLHAALQTQRGSPESIDKLSLGSVSPNVTTNFQKPIHRRSERQHTEKHYMESPTISSPSSVSYTGHGPESRASYDSPARRQSMEVDDVNAAESLIQIAESPMLGPVIERRRLTISELMHL